MHVERYHTTSTHPSTASPPPQGPGKPSGLNRSPASHRAPCSPATRIVYPHRASSPPLVSVRFPSSARPRSLHVQPIPPSPASQCTHLACDPRHVCTSTGVCVLPRVVHVAASGERRVGVSSLLQAGQVVHMAYCRAVCVSTVPYDVQLRATGCVVAMHTPVCCSTVVDVARNGGSGSQAHSSHVCGCVTCKLLSPRYQHAQLHQPLLSRTPALFSRRARAAPLVSSSLRGETLRSVS